MIKICTYSLLANLINSKFLSLNTVSLSTAVPDSFVFWRWFRLSQVLVFSTGMMKFSKFIWLGKLFQICAVVPLPSPLPFSCRVLSVCLAGTLLLLRWGTGLMQGAKLAKSFRIRFRMSELPDLLDCPFNWNQIKLPENWTAGTNLGLFKFSLS